MIKNGWSIVYKKAIQPDGSLLFPERLTHEFLDNARRTMGSYIFANQYQNEIIPDGEQTFKKHWLRYYDRLPSNYYTFCFIDPAISEASTSDYTGLCVVSVDPLKNWYVRLAQREKLNPSQLIELLFRLNSEFKPQTIGVEDVAFQRAIVHFAHEEMKRRNQYIPVSGVKIGQDRTKEMRILSLVPRFEFGSLFLSNACKDLELELAQFPRGSHDDCCFVADTIIATKNGPVPIQEIKVGDQIITPRGYDKITHISCRESEVISNLGLIGTTLHPVWTIDNLTSLIDVKESSKLSYFTCKGLIQQVVLNSYISTELNSEEWVGRDNITYLNILLTTKEKRRRLAFTLLFINFILERKFRKAIKFIIKTVIHSIMCLRILSVFQLVSISKKLQGTWRRLEQTWKKSGLLHPNGIQLQKVRNGIAKTVRNLGLKENLKQEVVSFVKRNFFLKCPILDFAIINVEVKAGGEENSIGLSRIAVNAQNRFLKKNELKPKPVLQNACIDLVYNLRTEKDHCYYANNILVSNCDSLASMQEIVYYPTEQRRDDVQPHNPNSPEYEKWYIRQLAKRANSFEGS